MKLNISYKIADRVISRQVSAPAQSQRDLTSVHDYIAWVADRNDPRIEVLES